MTDSQPARRAGAVLLGAALLAGALAPAAQAQAPALAATPSAAPSSSPSASAAAAAPGSARPVLVAPALLGPLPSESPQPVLKDVVLAWRAVPGAQGYRVQVSQDGEFSSDDLTFDGATVATRIALPALPNAAYRWRVAAQQATGHGFWSVPGAFTQGWREAPAGLRSSGESEFPTLAWEPVASASEYEVQISPDPQFALDPTQVQAGFGTTTCFTVRTRVTGANSQARAGNAGAGDCDFTGVRPGEAFHWRVRALDHVADDAGEVDTSPVVDTGISYQPLAPESDALDTGPCPKPAATAAPTPSGSASPSASPSGAPTVTDAATPSPSAAPGGRGGFSCAPKNVVQRSAWSTTQLTVWRPSPVAAATDETYLPLALRPLPAEHCTLREQVPGEGRSADCLEFPTLDWDAREGATGYRLYVALDDAFTNIHEIVETPATEWTPTTAWRDTSASQSYYYAVQACTPSRCGTVTATPDSLRKKSVATTLTSPAPGTALGRADVALRWRPYSATLRDALSARVPGTPASSEAYAYRVQVAEAPDDDRPATAADFQSPVEDVVVDGTLCRPGPVVADATVPLRTASRAVRSCSADGGYAVHDPATDEVVHVSSTKDLPTGSYVWRVQALDGSGRALPWSPAGRFTRDTTPPTATVSGLSAAVDSPFVVRFSEPVVGLSTSTVTVTPAPARLEVAADRRSVTLRPVGTWLPGQSYAVRVGTGLADDVGNPLVPVRATAVVGKRVDDGSPALRYGGTWTRRTASNAVGGGFRTTTPTMRTQSTAAVTLQGAGVLVTGCVGPAGGMMDVWVDGTKRARVDTYRSYSGCGLRLSRVVLAPGTHRVQLRAVGVKRPASKGRSVGLDAVTAL